MDIIKKFLKNTPLPKTKLCKCLKKQNCPMGGANLTENVLYYAKIKRSNEKFRSKLYKGMLHKEKIL